MKCLDSDYSIAFFEEAGNRLTAMRGPFSLP